MTSTPAPLTPALPTYLNVRRGLVSWLTTTNHKRIGIMYLCGILFFFLFGAAMAVTFRLKLYSPGLHFISNETYNRLLTLHGVALFDPSRGGDPVLFQHLFWTYSHPAVYIMILPAMGVASEIIPTFSRKTIFGYKYIAFSSVAIASIGSLVWGHHMFTAGMSEFARVIFSFLTFLVAVPSAVKVFNWLATMYRGSIYLGPPMVFALMFIFLFSIGGLTGLILGSLATNIHVHDTAFVPAHFHYTMFGGAMVVFFGALHYWWPKMFGRMYDFSRAHLSEMLFFIGFNLTYFPLFLAGMHGMPRRYADYLPEFTVYHRTSTIGSWIMVSAILLMLGNLVVTLFNGKRVKDQNPWGGATLEWQIPSPPPSSNFVTPPDLSRGPYEYPVEVQDP